jgi:transposase-like protein
MERFSKKSSSKWHDRYSEEFKRFVCEEFLRSSATKQEIEIEYNIGKSRLTYWLRERGYDSKKPGIISLPNMEKQVNKLSSEERESLLHLKKELQEAQLLAEAYRKMIVLAEQEFKIQIVKKSNTK